jgi:hypothetical protein
MKWKRPGKGSLGIGVLFLAIEESDSVAVFVDPLLCSCPLLGLFAAFGSGLAWQ